MAGQYSDTVRFVRLTVIAAALLACASFSTRTAPAQVVPAAPKDQMFSGTVTAVTDAGLTVVRSGSKTAKTFSITAQTKFEGPKPQVNSHVTVRYVSGDDGDRAVRVIVRPPATKK